MGATRRSRSRSTACSRSSTPHGRPSPPRPGSSRRPMRTCGSCSSRRAGSSSCPTGSRSSPSLERPEQLERAQQASLQASFAPAASNVLGGPAYANGWAFPVGGGPEVVSASHTHHDYPAVDIAAPAGSPVYALGNGTVQRAWSWPDPRCGIGLTLQTRDGQTWTYCHLAELDPSVVAGVTVAAGEQLGL